MTTQRNGGWVCPECGFECGADHEECGNCGERRTPNDCPECERSYGPHYRGECEHG